MESPFSSIASCAWFTCVAVVTVGYGDLIPITPGGRVVASMAMLAGTLVIALPVTVVGSTFHAVLFRMASYVQSSISKQEVSELAVASQLTAQQGISALAGSSATTKPARLRDRLRLPDTSFSYGLKTRGLPEANAPHLQSQRVGELVAELDAEEANESTNPYLASMRKVARSTMVTTQYQWAVRCPCSHSHPRLAAVMTVQTQNGCVPQGDEVDDSQPRCAGADSRER